MVPHPLLWLHRLKKPDDSIYGVRLHLDNVAATESSDLLDSRSLQKKSLGISKKEANDRYDALRVLHATIHNESLWHAIGTNGDVKCLLDV